MNWEQVESKWQQLMASAKENWAKLSDDDLQQVSVKREQLAAKILGASHQASKRVAA